MQTFTKGPDLEETLAILTDTPMLLGHLLGVPLWLDTQRRVIFNKEHEIEWPIDSPYLRGTKLLEAVKAYIHDV